MVHPDFAGADSELRFRNKYVFSVRSPARRSEFVIGVLGNLLHASSVRMHDPDVLAAFAVGNESDPLPIRRKLWLAVEGHPTGDRFRLAAFDGECEDVAQQFEYNGLAVGRSVQRKPGTLIGRELDFSVGLQRQTLLLVLFSSFFSSCLSFSCATAS